jgi:hypothetical protein
MGYLSTHPWGNCDSSVYFEGWVERVENSEWTREHENHVGVMVHKETGEEVDASDWIEIETGRVLSTTDAVDEAIEEGEWDYDEEIEAVLRSVQEERRYGVWGGMGSEPSTHEEYHAAMSDMDPRDA